MSPAYRARFHLERCRGLAHALAERIALEPIGPRVTGQTLTTSLDVLARELDLAMLALSPPKPPLRKESRGSVTVHDTGSGYGR